MPVPKVRNSTESSWLERMLTLVNVQRETVLQAEGCTSSPVRISNRNCPMVPPKMVLRQLAAIRVSAVGARFQRKLVKRLVSESHVKEPSKAGPTFEPL